MCKTQTERETESQSKSFVLYILPEFRFNLEKLLHEGIGLRLVIKAKSSIHVFKRDPLIS